MRIPAPATLLLPLLLSSAAFAVEVSPVFNAHFLGGQYFFESQESNVSGNAGFLAAPAIGFNERWALIPSFSSSWRGTKSVQDLVGGGTVFQQTQDHTANLKAVYSPVKVWQFKAGGGYHLELLKETRDESWGKGLYDYQKFSTNIEAERSIGKDASVRVGFDYYLIDFRNYATLESESPDLGRENAGTRTLNTFNTSPYLALRAPLPLPGGRRGSVELSYYHAFRDFPDQNVVLIDGSFAKDRRRDVNQTFAAEADAPFDLRDGLRLLAEVHGSYNRLLSNQNNYDAGKTQFNPDFYAYTEYSGGPTLNFLAGPKPWIFSAGFTYVRRDYSDRPVQDGTGAYIGGKIHNDEYYATLAVGYPISKNFRLQAQSDFGWIRSNMNYEAVYRYNYTTATYLAGVVYEY